MKQHPVKYRGLLWDRDQFIFGDAITGDGKYLIQRPNGSRKHEISFQLQPNSAALLLGYDKNGAEVYEGDVIINDCGQEFRADSYATVVDWYTLKESQS